ncbi:hypothetical protein OKA05_18955 [Luteolibacter arcticus]|uniref:Uncharacterized protein n=1 Tax=Luteolibacter arcticus TaxID=1581411 RepID=A0ABT3GMA5_9BACT|nr:hypothetical protein [Luteolibacter arcticus]MCW1924652.1 hypothetical protein [Luteolibacter arcticus]
MRIFISTFLLGALLSSADAGEFSRKAPFESVEDFVEAAKGFQPAASGSDLSVLFTVPELGQSEDPQDGKPVLAKTIESCEAVWANDSHALVFVKALPPTEATRSVTGVLFLLQRTGDSWHISDSRQFTATGKDAGISAKLTAATGSGPDRLGTEGFPPVVTIAESQGGRGYSYDLSASYTLRASKLERLDLK